MNKQHPVPHIGNVKTFKPHNNTQIKLQPTILLLFLIFFSFGIYLQAINQETFLRNSKQIHLEDLKTNIYHSTAPSQLPTLSKAYRITRSLRKTFLKTKSEDKFPKYGQQIYSPQNGQMNFVENVCLNNDDKIKPIDFISLSEVYKMNFLSSFPVVNSSIYKPQFLSQLDFYKQTRITWLEGTTLHAPCWRTKRNNFQPSHFLFGIGKLFSIAHDKTLANNQVYFDHVVFHQCPDVNNMQWSQNVWNIILSSFYNSKVVSAETNYFYIPYEGISREDLMLCSDKLLMTSFQSKSFHKNNYEIVSIWRTALSEYITKEISETIQEPLFTETDALSVKVTKRSVRFALFKRDAEGTARNLCNIAGLKDAIKKYSDLSLDIITTNSSTPFLEQVKVFNSFDVLITPHGSHLTNGIFMQQPKVQDRVIIEIVPLTINKDFQNNLNMFSSYYISEHHLPQDKSKKELYNICTNSLNPCDQLQKRFLAEGCTVINITILDQLLREVLRV